LRRKEDAIRYGIKRKQQVIGISIKRQDEMQGEVLLLRRKRQGKSLLMSWRVQQERRIYKGCKANGKIQAGCSRSKLCERWK